MLCFAIFVIGYLVVLISMFSITSPKMAYLAYICVIINTILFFITMCGNPGIDDVIIEHYYKTRYGDKLDEEIDDDIENIVDTPQDEDDEELNEEIAISDNNLVNRKV